MIVKCNTEAEPTQPVCTTAVDKLDFTQIMSIHQQSGHPGIKCTLYFLKQIDPGVSKAAVKEVVG